MTRIPPATMVTTTASLRAYCDRWAAEPLLAIDTESNSLHAYEEQVCLIQLSTREADFIIDPLTIESLDPLGELLANPAIEVVFHAAEYDIMCLKRDFGFRFSNLFDTMLAARICGADKLGLGSMLEEHFGVKVNKKYQRANWGERPLSKEMLHYAQLDTHFLPALRDYWREQLIAMGRWEEAQETFAMLTETPAATPHFDPDGFWRINGAHKLSPQQIAILRELFLLREEKARQRDYPPFKIMSDRVLMELAQLAPQSISELQRSSSLSSHQIRRYGREILSAIERGRQATPPRRPNNQRPTDIVMARFEALRDWRKHRARRRGVESDIIISKDALWALARVAPRTVEELQKIHELGPWKTRTYGSEILDVLATVERQNHRRKS
ncbi:MAG: ribonuclease D [Anaerolineae bacterium]